MSAHSVALIWPGSAGELCSSYHVRVRAPRAHGTHVSVLHSAKLASRASGKCQLAGIVPLSWLLPKKRICSAGDELEASAR